MVVFYLLLVGDVTERSTPRQRNGTTGLKERGEFRALAGIGFQAQVTRVVRSRGCSCNDQWLRRMAPAH